MSAASGKPAGRRVPDVGDADCGCAGPGAVCGWHTSKPAASGKPAAHTPPPVGKDGLPTPILVWYEKRGKELHITNEHLSDAPASVFRAAPDLLAACEAIEALIERCERCNGTGRRLDALEDACARCGGVGSTLYATAEIGSLRAAILKARGDSSPSKGGV